MCGLLRSRLSWLTCLAAGVRDPSCVGRSSGRPVAADSRRGGRVSSRIENPRQLAEGVYQLEAAQGIAEIRCRQGILQLHQRQAASNQLIEYFEKKLRPRKKYELLDKIAGGGIAAGLHIIETPKTGNLKFAAKPRGVLVVEGKDEKTTTVFVKAALDLVQQELARQEKSQDPHEQLREHPRRITSARNFTLPRSGATIIFANHADAARKPASICTGAARAAQAF